MTTTSDFETFAKFDPVGAHAYVRNLQKAHVPVHAEAFELVPEDSPILRARAEEMSFGQLDSVDPIDTGLKLVETMLRKGGVGIAAPQVGLGIRMIAIRSNPIIVCINPTIIDVGSGKLSEANIEGCLSFPGLAVKVKRYQSIRLRYTRPNGEIVTETYAGLTASVIQHEIDHLDGILYYERASRYHRDQAFKQRNRR